MCAHTMDKLLSRQANPKQRTTSWTSLLKPVTNEQYHLRATPAWLRMTWLLNTEPMLLDPGRLQSIAQHINKPTVKQSALGLRWCKHS